MSRYDDIAANNKIRPFEDVLGNAANIASEAGRTMFQVGQGVMQNAPQAVAENPSLFSKGGIPAVQARAGAGAVNAIGSLFNLAEPLKPETTSFSDQYMKPQSPLGKILGYGGNFATSFLNPSKMVGAAAEGIHNYPDEVITSIRPKIAQWMKSQGKAYDTAENAVLGGQEVDPNSILEALRPIVSDENLGKLADPDFINSLNEFYQRANELKDMGLKFPATEVKAMKDAIQNLGMEMGTVSGNFANQAMGGLTKTLENFPGYQAMQKQWADFAGLRNFANANIKPWLSKTNPFDTTKAVNVLRKVGKDSGITRGMEALEKTVPEIGKFVGKMKAINSFTPIARGASRIASSPLPWTAAGAGGMLGLYKLLAPTAQRILGIKGGGMPKEIGIEMESAPGPSMH